MALLGIVKLKVFASLVEGSNPFELRDLSTHDLCGFGGKLVTPFCALLIISCTKRDVVCAMQRAGKVRQASGKAQQRVRTSDSQ